MNKKIGLIVSAACILGTTLIPRPSYALSLSSVKNIISSFQSKIQGELTQFQQSIQKQVGEWAGLQNSANQALTANQGLLGTSDPIASGKALKISIGSQYSLPVGSQKAQELERTIARVFVSQILGQQGQNELSNKITETTNTAQNAFDLGDQAQNLNSSQDVLKAIAAQNAQIATMLGEQRTDALQARQDNANNTLMLSQIAEQSANAAKRQDIQSSGVVSLSQEVAAMSTLDPTNPAADSSDP